MLCGGRLQAYNPIVGSGPHGATLHFRTGENITQAYAPISNADKSQFILVDAAPELEGYASDLTRTYTRYPQHATQEMRLLHKAVQNIQSGAILVFKEGSSWAQVDRRALELLTEALMDLQLLHGPYEKLVQDRVAYAFMPHGLGHPVGLDVHDPIPTEYKMAPIDSSASNSDLNLLSRLSIKSIDFPIVRGSVMTIEPGIYFIPHWLDSLRGNKTDSLGQWINWTQVDEFGYGIGGVRIEDTIAIDPLTGDSVILTDF